MEVFGLEYLSKQVVEHLLKSCEDKHEPDKWNWTPYNPDKIRNLKEIVKMEMDEVRYAGLTNYTPSNKRQKVVLIFSYGNLSYGLIKHLKQEKIKFFFIDFLQFTLKGKINIRIENGKQKKMLQMEDLILNIDDVSIVLWNPPPRALFHPIFDSDFIPQSDEKERHFFLYKKRWLQLLRDLILLVPCDTVWLPGNPLKGSQDWQNKIGEYSLAERIGLNIPPTIFTNDLEELKDFQLKYGDKYVLREFSSPPWSFPPIVHRPDEISYKNFEKAPSCFQQYIEKLYEYRVVILFDKIFPCRIYSQDSELTKDDWRVYDDKNVKWELTQLPKDLKNKLIQINKKLGLTWSSVDLIYATDKKYYFLEANRPGAHYWLEPFVGLDITKEIVDEVKKRQLADEL